MQLTERDALGAHARDELGISETVTAHPIQAAVVSALTFAVGAAVPLIVALLAPRRRSASSWPGRRWSPWRFSAASAPPPEARASSRGPSALAHAINLNAYADYAEQPGILAAHSAGNSPTTVRISRPTASSTRSATASWPTSACRG